MRLTSRQLGRLMVMQALLWWSTALQAAGPSATATVTLNITVVQPPCSISLPATVSLGSILESVRSYPPFSIDISCTAGSTTVTSLFAEIVQGSLTPGYADRIDMTGPAGSSGTAAQLWLTAPDGGRVVMDGSGSTEAGSQFCEGSSSRQCTLTPYTRTVADTPRGETTAVVRFSVAYP